LKCPERILETLQRNANTNLVDLEARMHAVIGGCLAGLGRYEEAEIHLLDAHLRNCPSR